MNEERAERTRLLAASYRYSVNRLQPQRRRVRAVETARESQRQIIVDSGDGSMLERRSSRPTTPAVIEREAIDKEMMMLKQAIKALNISNTKLKTKNISLEEQVCNLKDSMQDKPERKHLIRTESAATTAMFANLKRDLDQTIRENTTLKRDVKYARLAELQAENKANMVELEQLRELLREEKEVSEGLKQERREIKEQHRLEGRKMQDRIQKLQQEDHYLRQNNQPAADKVRVRAWSSLQMRKVEQNSQATLEMKAQIQSLKKHLEKSQQQCNELRNKHSLKPTKDVGIQADKKCPKCVELKQSLKSQNTKSRKKIQQLKAQIKQLQQFPKYRVMNVEMAPPTVEESDHLRRFIILRLTAFDISLDEATYLLEGKGSNPEMTVFDLVTAQPFSKLTDRYHQILVFHLCLKDQQHNETIQVDENKPFPISFIQHNFRTFLGEFTIPSDSQRRQLYKRVAEFLTDQKIKILELLEMSNNEDRITINYYNFRYVMSGLGIDEDCIVVMIRAMVIESLDLDHLDYRQLFQIYVVDDAVPIDNPKMERSAQERCVNPNPEVVPSDKQSNQEDDIPFMNLDPSQLYSTKQNSRI